MRASSPAMRQLSSEGQRLVNDLASRHGFSPDAVTHMLFAVLNGNSSMAQFSHGEFAGSGQWMRGGMIMIGDMFNNYLKGRIDNLCSEIANVLVNQPGLIQSGSFQSQSQSGSDHQSQNYGAPMGQSSFFVPDPEDFWWPQQFGSPTATGSQNNIRYAYFAGARRLAVKTGSEVWVYDTQDHQIGGFSQQQGVGGSITFTSQFGTVPLTSLPVALRNGQELTYTPLAPPVAENSFNNTNPSFTSNGTSAANANSTDAIATAIERLGQLKDKGLLSDQEFATKKAELLSRL